MFSRFSAKGLVDHNWDRHPLPNWRIVEIGGADGLKFEDRDLAGQDPEVGFTDTHRTHVVINVNHTIREGLGAQSTEYKVRAKYVVPEGATIGVESDNPYPARHASGKVDNRLH